MAMTVESPCGKVFSPYDLITSRGSESSTTHYPCGCRSVSFLDGGELAEEDFLSVEVIDSKRVRC